MKRIELTIKEDGNYTIDLAEGFSGQSCAQKAQNIISLIGGTETKSQVKPEYYNGEPDNLNELFTNK